MDQTFVRQRNSCSYDKSPFLLPRKFRRFAEFVQAFFMDRVRDYLLLTADVMVEVFNCVQKFPARNRTAVVVGVNLRPGAHNVMIPGGYGQPFADSWNVFKSHGSTVPRQPLDRPFKVHVLSLR